MKTLRPEGVTIWVRNIYLFGGISEGAPQEWFDETQPPQPAPGASEFVKLIVSSSNAGFKNVDGTGTTGGVFCDNS